MKKLSILFLLTVVLASFTFAIEGIGDFKAGLELGFDNVGGGNDGALSVSIEPTINFTRAFGAVGLSATLGDVLYIPTDEDKQGDKMGDEIYLNITPSYSLAAGPGELGFALGFELRFPLTDEGYGLSTESDHPYGSKQDALYFRIDPSVSYGFDASFGALAFELGTDHLQITKNHGGDAKDGYGLDRIPIYLKAGVELPMGLGIWLKPYFGIATESEDDTELDKFVFDVHYAVTETITAGVETTFPAHDMGTTGVKIIPYGEFSFGALGAYAKIELTKIGTDNDDIEIKPIVGVTYSF
jgi:hypothetical protein